MAGTVWSTGQGRTERMTRLRKQSQFPHAHGLRDLLFETKPISAPPAEPAGERAKQSQLATAGPVKTCGAGRAKQSQFPAVWPVGTRGTWRAKQSQFAQAIGCKYFVKKELRYVGIRTECGRTGPILPTGGKPLRQSWALTRTARRIIKKPSDQGEFTGNVGHG